MAGVPTLQLKKGNFKQVEISALWTVTVEVRGTTCIIDLRDARGNRLSQAQQGTVSASELHRAAWALGHNDEVGKNGNGDWVYAINVAHLFIQKNELITDGPFDSGSIQMTIMSEVARSRLQAAMEWAYKKITRKK